MELVPNDAGVIENAYSSISACAASFKVDITAGEIADLAVRNDFGDAELAAVNVVFEYLAKKYHDSKIETLLRLSRLPRKVPKTFEGFDFSRIQEGTRAH